MSNPRELNCDGTTDGLDNKPVHVETLAGELKCDEILNHFSAFGRNSAKALETEIQTIAGVVATIADDDRPQDETTFWEVNDDCIHGILSTECLSALDLCSVAETHPRFKEIAVGTFKRKHGKCDLSSLAEGRAKSAQRLLRNFGAVISDLTIDGWYFQDNESSVWKSVARHCSNTLESLYLRRIVVFDNFPGKLKRIFNNLHKLGVYDCRFEGASKELFAHCGSLVELELTRGDFGFIIENTFPKLQKFKCECDYTTADEINLHSFILRHKNLTSISMHVYDRMQVLGDNCKQLEELEFMLHEDQTFDLSNFGHLRKLKINVLMGNVTKVVRGWNDLQFLEQLTLKRVDVDPEFIKTLSQLKRLQVLRLLNCYGLTDLHRIGDLNQLTELEIESNAFFDLDFVALIKRLRNLKALSVTGFRLKIDLETYLRIVDVVRARPDKSKLTFTVRDNSPQLYDADTLHNFSRDADVVEMITGK